MDDIWTSIPWNCGERDCPVGWHLANYWTGDDGHTVDRYGDGDHDEIDEADLPTLDEIHTAWVEYAQYVAATGSDPLCNYMVRRLIKRRDRWVFNINDSIIGPVLVGARHAGRFYDPRNVPPHVAEWLNLNRANGRLQDFETMAALCEAVPDIKRGRLSTLLDNTAPRKASTVATELKAAARRHLKEAALRGKGADR